MSDSEKLDLIFQKVTDMQADMHEMKVDVQGLKEDVGTLKVETETLKSDMKKVQADLSSLKLRVENEIAVNVQRVAEGHLDLSRNLHEAMKPNNEVEMLSVKVRMLETDVRKLKQVCALS